jgi:hypothetical protein
VGERVLVEFTYRTGWTNGLASIETTSQGITFCTQVDQNIIIGPAPVKPRFAVGDEVVVRSTLETVVIREIGMITGSFYVAAPGHPIFITNECDLLSLAEARERLAK